MSEATEALETEAETFDLADAFLPDDFVSEEEASAEDGPLSHPLDSDRILKNLRIIRGGATIRIIGTPRA